MQTGAKLGVLLIGVALATTLTLPDRKTPDVLKVVFSGARGLLATAMGTGKQV